MDSAHQDVYECEVCNSYCSLCALNGHKSTSKFDLET